MRMWSLFCCKGRIAKAIECQFATERGLTSVKYLFNATFRMHFQKACAEAGRSRNKNGLHQAYSIHMKDLYSPLHGILD